MERYRLKWTPANIVAIVLAVAYLAGAVWLQDQRMFWGLLLFLVWTTSMILFTDKWVHGIRMGGGIANLFPAGDQERSFNIIAWILHLLPAALFIFVKIPEKMDL